MMSKQVKPIIDSYTQICEELLLWGMTSENFKTLNKELSNQLPIRDNFIEVIHNLALKILGEETFKLTKLEIFIPSLYSTLLDTSEKTLEKVQKVFRAFSEPDLVIDIHEIQIQINHFFNKYFTSKYLNDSDEDIENGIVEADVLQAEIFDLNFPVVSVPISPISKDLILEEIEPYIITYYLEKIRELIYFNKNLLLTLIKYLFGGTSLTTDQFSENISKVIRRSVEFQDFHQPLEDYCIQIHQKLYSKSSTSNTSFQEQLQQGLERINSQEESMPLLNVQKMEEIETKITQLKFQEVPLYDQQQGNFTSDSGFNPDQLTAADALSSLNNNNNNNSNNNNSNNNNSNTQLESDNFFL